MLHFVPQPTLLQRRRGNVIQYPCLLCKRFANPNAHLRVGKKRRVVDRLLADSASCRLVAKYCHRCGHRHLSDQVNSYAAPEAPPPPTNHLEESVLDGGFRRVTHRVGGKKDSVYGSFAVSLVPFAPSPLSSMRVIRHIRKFYFAVAQLHRCEHAPSTRPLCAVLNQDFCCWCVKPFDWLSLILQPFCSSFLHTGADEWQHDFC